MVEQNVKAEAKAVKTIKEAVERYAEELRDVGAAARKELAAKERVAQEAQERRRADLARATNKLQEAQAALARCEENCGGLERAVAAAAQRQAEAKQSLDRARRAGQILGDARSNLIPVLQKVEATVAEHSSVASSALADLEAKLRDLGDLRGQREFRSIATGVVVAAEVATASVNFSKLGIDMANAFGADLAGGRDNIAELRQDQALDELEHVAKETMYKLPGEFQIIPPQEEL